ncbi:MAG: glycosyltransferase family 2 protein [Acidimicrobiales bacterium]
MSSAASATDHLADAKASALDDLSVSVVIATRDRPQLLARAIAGVLAQDDVGDLEIVLVFDHSEPDHSLGLDEPGRRIRVTTNERKPGLAGARNSGVAKATHPWVAFCDDDDEWLPGKLAAQFAALRTTPSALVATTGVFINFDDEDTERIPDPAKLTFEDFIRDRMTEVHPSATLFLAAAWGAIGQVDEDIPGGYAEDYDWLLRAAKIAPIAAATQPLVRVYWHGASFFFERWRMIDEALGYLVDKFPEFHDDPVGLARIRGQQAVAQAAMGERGRAFRTAVETFKLSPKERRVPVALVVAAGVPAASILKLLHRFGKGI